MMLCLPILAHDFSWDMAIYFIFGLSTRTAEVIVVLVIKFFVACVVSETLKEK